MKKKILVVGSGEHSTLDASNFDMVYVSNSALTRVANAKDIYLVISDAMLFSVDTLDRHPPISGLDRNASNAFRLKKYSTIDSKFYEAIIVVDNNSVDIEAAIKRKNISFNVLKRLPAAQLWRLIWRCFEVDELISIFLNLAGFQTKLRFLVQMLTKQRMSVSFRPSTGIVALMAAYCNHPGAEIYISGLNIFHKTGARPGVYSTGRLTHDPKIHLMDRVYGALLQKKGVLVHPVPITR